MEHPLRRPVSWTIASSTVALVMLPRASAVAARDAGASSDLTQAGEAPADRPSGAIVAGASLDRRPEGVAATPYELESYETSVGATPLVQGDPATFELYGFKLGMSVREADRNARRLHLRFNGGDFMSPSFDGRAAVRAAGLVGGKIPKVPRVLARTSMADSEGNHYLPEFLPMEAGASLSSVTYWAPGRATPQANIWPRLRPNTVSQRRSTRASTISGEMVLEGRSRCPLRRVACARRTRLGPGRHRAPPGNPCPDQSRSPRPGEGRDDRGLGAAPAGFLIALLGG